MRPPQSRTPRIEIGNTEVLRALILNVTAALTTLLLLRFATLLVPDASETTIPAYLQLISEPLVWPFRFIPPLSTAVLGDAQVIDLLIIPGVAITGLLVAGILTGWRETGGRPRGHPALRE
jgi:uncharacterized protein YggT (Ycf19 family)